MDFLYKGEYIKWGFDNNIFCYIAIKNILLLFLFTYWCI